MKALIATGKNIEVLPLTIDDTAGATVAQLRARAFREKRQHGELGLIVVDYLQLLIAGRAETRVQEVSEITRGLKMLAKELHVPVVALSQLSRAVEQRENKRPLLSDLRESGSIEQDADVVVFVYREEYYLQREEPVRGASESDTAFNNRFEQWQQNLGRVRSLAELIIAKNRHGETGSIKVRFDAERTRFETLAWRQTI
jgi:replicative DNA helicase